MQVPHWPTPQWHSPTSSWMPILPSSPQVPTSSSLPTRMAAPQSLHTTQTTRTCASMPRTPSPLPAVPTSHPWCSTFPSRARNASPTLPPATATLPSAILPKATGLLPGPAAPLKLPSPWAKRQHTVPMVNPKPASSASPAWISLAAANLAESLPPSLPNPTTSRQQPLKAARAMYS